MSIEQVGLQLGLAGLIIVAGYKAAMLLIMKWSEAELARNKSWSEAESKRATAIETNFATLLLRLDTHATADAVAHGETTERVSRFEGKLDEILHWYERTPVGTNPPPTSESAEPRPGDSRPSHYPFSKTNPRRR